MSTDTHSKQATILSDLAVGIAGGLAEIVVVCSYTALTGGNASSVAIGISDAVGLHGASAAVGLGIHMALAAALGVLLTAARPNSVRPLTFMLGSLAAVWAINFFIVLPSLSPTFLHLLPYAVTFASKLAFGFAAAGVLTLQAAVRPALFGSLRFPASPVAAVRR